MPKIVEVYVRKPHSTLRDTSVVRFRTKKHHYSALVRDGSLSVASIVRWSESDAHRLHRDSKQARAIETLLRELRNEQTTDPVPEGRDQ